MSALLGPSGAGKTTLMDIIAGRSTSGHLEGDVWINGVPRMAHWKRLSAYVEQSEALIRGLTVHEMLYYAARLKLPQKMSLVKKRERVHQIIHDLDLERAANTRIGSQMGTSISGGEAKRVNIALAILSNPRVIFFDEPTSGLDSSMSREVVRTIRHLANTGRTCICTIHQPSPDIFNMFDAVTLIANGMVVYCGPRSEAEQFFRGRSLGMREEELTGVEAQKQGRLHQMLMNNDPNVNMSEVMLESLTGIDMTEVKAVREEFMGTAVYASMLKEIKEYKSSAGVRTKGEHFKPEDGEEAEESSPAIRDAAVADVQKYSTSWLLAVWVLMLRSAVSCFMDLDFIIRRIGQRALLGFIVASIYPLLPFTTDSVPNRMSMLFLSSVFCGIACVQNVLSSLEDRLVFLKERADGYYRVSSYYVAQFLIEWPPAILASFLYVTIIFWITRYSTSLIVYFYFFLNILITSVAGIALSTAITSFVYGLEMATTIAIIIIFVFAVFGGYLIRGSDIPVYWRWANISSFLRMSFEGNLSMSLIHHNYKLSTCNLPASALAAGAHCPPVNGTIVMDKLKLRSTKPWMCLIQLMIFTVIVQIISFIGLRFLRPKRR
eukprot:TRINITY_DN7584_c0_g2_i1.p1 TRINITY_DN7584_c0_g2~~TRINITY_DN7584_c0_g2_i1.p1  ORF type:complete len:680 (+),score=177.62 TRINITY_DN7584_c0_g2_i1:223-2040(+)